MKINEVLKRTTEHFKKKGLETARLDAEILLSHALQWQRIELYSKFDYPLSDDELGTCREVVRRRGEGEPVAYIVGQKGFYKNDFTVSPDVLIPRPETECLVERVLEDFADHQPKTFADFGTGSGCIGLSLLAEWQEAHLKAYDVSAEALLVAKNNAENLELGERCEFIHLSIDQISEKEFDCIVANPPYIGEGDDRLSPEVKKHEPGQALFAGDNGLEQLRVWAEKALELLVPGGRYFCEFGEGQVPALKEVLQAQGWAKINFHKDLAGIDRFFEVQKSDD